LIFISSDPGFYDCTGGLLALLKAATVSMLNGIRFLRVFYYLNLIQGAVVIFLAVKTTFRYIAADA
jgi:hypothetical protein